MTPRQLLEAAGAALDPGPGEWMLSVAYNEQTKVRFIRVESRYTDGRLDQPLID